jgi:hypothetical protein
MRKEKDNGNQSGVIQNRKIWHCTAIRFMHGLLNLTPSRYFLFSLLQLYCQHKRLTVISAL